MRSIGLCPYCEKKLEEGGGEYKGRICFGCGVVWMGLFMRTRGKDGWWNNVPDGCFVVRDEVTV